MVLRIIAFATVVAAGGTFHAQTPLAAEVTPGALHQVQVFETNLRAAIERAGGEMAKRARQVVPGIRLNFETEIRIFSAVLPNGAVFFVEVPAIEATSAQLWDLKRQMSQPPNGLPRVGNPTGPGLVGPSATLADPLLMTDPVKEYSELTRQALVDAMLDNAFALQLKEGQALTLVVGVGGISSTTEITEVPRKLYLTLKSEDLLALRQNRITRDEARARIIESRY